MDTATIFRVAGPGTGSVYFLSDHTWPWGPWEELDSTVGLSLHSYGEATTLQAPSRAAALRPLTQCSVSKPNALFGFHGELCCAHTSV